VVAEQQVVSDLADRWAHVARVALYRQ
jgi:hypothetical protein